MGIGVYRITRKKIRINKPIYKKKKKKIIKIKKKKKLELKKKFYKKKYF